MLLVFLVLCIVLFALYSIDYILLFRATFMLALVLLHTECPFTRISSSIVCGFVFVFLFLSIVGFRKQRNEQVSKCIYLFLDDHLILISEIYYLHP